MKKFLIGFLIFYSLSSFLPLWETYHWSVRMFDFPRMQLMVLGLIAFIGFILKSKKEKKSYLLIIPLVSLGLDVYRLYPYSPIARIESKMHKSNAKEFSILTFNVWQFNDKKKELLDLIKEKSPDLVFLYEVDLKWAQFIKDIPNYPVQNIDPLNNTYGIAFLSKHPVESIKLNYLVNKDVPSYEIKYQGVTIFAVHPKPPAPPITSEKRDAELVLVAKKSRAIKGPVLVVGDMNDVAWSHTTRLFRRISELLDPRVGRRPVSTYPSLNVLFRFPLDYIFHSKELKLTSIEVLPDIGSDHLPLMASFFVDYSSQQRSSEQPEPEDFEDAREIIKDGRQKP